MPVLLDICRDVIMFYLIMNQSKKVSITKGFQLSFEHSFVTL